jgi:hypothetical protein
MQLEGICWDIPRGNKKVWPVLVFEKMKHGDLDRFLNLDIGEKLCLQDRLKLCADVASAVATMHSCRKQLLAFRFVCEHRLTVAQVLFTEILNLKTYLYPTTTTAAILQW